MVEFVKRFLRKVQASENWSEPIQQEKLTLEIVQHLEAQNERAKAQHQEIVEVLSPKLSPR